jgi:hypothetical protein
MPKSVMMKAFTNSTAAGSGNDDGPVKHRCSAGRPKIRALRHDDQPDEVIDFVASALVGQG